MVLTITRNSPIQVSGVTNIKMIAAGLGYSLALKEDGTVWVWGSAPLGDYWFPGYSPKQIKGLTNIKMIAAGYGYSLALKEDGTVWVWGSNGPMQVLGLINVKAIAAGDHSIALKEDGTVWAWGTNDNGQLGDGTNYCRDIPVQVYGLTNVNTIVAGDTCNFAIKDDGTIWAWGDNEYSQLGIGFVSYKCTPVCVQQIEQPVLSENYPPRFISINDQPVGSIGRFTINQGQSLQFTINAFDPNGDELTYSTQDLPYGAAFDPAIHIFTWTPDYNQAGEYPVTFEVSDGMLHDMTTVTIDVLEQAIPTPTPTPTPTVLSENHAPKFALQNTNFTINRNDRFEVNLIANDPDGDQLYYDFDYTNSQLCNLISAIDQSTGKYTISGQNGMRLGTYTDYITVTDGELSDTIAITITIQDDTPPVIIPVDPLTVTVGQLVKIPIIVTDPDDNYSDLYIQINSDENTPVNMNYNCGYISNGQFHNGYLIWQPGYNQVGNFTINVSATDPANNSTVLPIYITANPVNSLTAITGGSSIETDGYGSYLLLKDNGTILTWGGSDISGDGQDTIPKIIPTYVLNFDGSVFSNVKAISVGRSGDSYALALKNDGTIWAWGYNGDGELGCGKASTQFDFNYTKPNPVQVTNSDGTPFTNVKTIKSNGWMSFAIKNDGTIWRWGGGSYYPIQITDENCNDIKDIFGVAPGNSFSKNSYMFLKNNGSVWRIDNQLIPVKDINGNSLTGITSLEADEEVLTIVALKNDGTIWAYGHGQTPFPHNINNNYIFSPINNADGTVFSDVKSIFIGPNYWIAIKNDGTVWGWGNLCDWTNNSYNSPYPIQLFDTNNNFKSFAIDQDDVIALKNDGTVWTWGDNDWGYIGTGVVNDTKIEIPIQLMIPADTNPINNTTPDNKQVIDITSGIKLNFDNVTSGFNCSFRQDRIRHRSIYHSGA